MLLNTPVAIGTTTLSISHGTPLITFGSCFADHIGLKLQAAGHDIVCNPFGTLYNPYSIALALTHALDDREIDASWTIQCQGVWHSWMHHSRFSHPDHDICLQNCNRAIHLAHGQMQKHPVLLITFGTAYVYTLASGPCQGRIVANCHKVPPQHFTRSRLTVAQIVDIWLPLLHRLAELGCPVVFTVSPIRHLADGLHANQLSKSTLLLAVDALLANKAPCTSTAPFEYFPAYEILNDQLRDYRYYARDMCHPSDLAVDIVWQHFQDTYMSPSTQQQNILHTKAALRTAHRPIINNTKTQKQTDTL